MRHDFQSVCSDAIQRVDAGWCDTIKGVKKEISVWAKKIPRPDKELWRLEGKIDKLQKRPRDQQDSQEERELRDQYNIVLL